MIRPLTLSWRFQLVRKGCSNHVFNLQCAAVSSTVVNWVESKALFVDENSHKRHMEEQLLSYYNRYKKTCSVHG